MPDYLDSLANAAKESIAEGYYKSTVQVSGKPLSLRKAILKCQRAPIISEIKFASPSSGTLRKDGQLAEIGDAWRLIERQ